MEEVPLMPHRVPAVPRLALLATLLGVAACAPRTFNKELPASSPASALAPAAPLPAVMGRALREDPPLPGESTEGWSGLAPEAGSPQEGGHAHP